MSLPAQAAAPRPNRTFLIVLAVLAVLALSFLSFATLVTDRMWFGSMGQTAVFDRILLTQLGLFLGTAVISAAFAFANIWFALRSLPPRLVSIELPGVPDPARVEKFLRRGALIALPLVVALMVGAGAASSWQVWLAFWNAQPFGKTDETFGLDISYFMFQQPFLRSIQSQVMGLLIITALASFLVHYLAGGIRIRQSATADRPQVDLADGTRRHIALLGGAVLVDFAWSLWLDRYDLVTGDNALITGITFVDANVHLPALNMLSGIALVCAALFFANFFRSNWRLPTLAIGLFVVSSVLLGGAWPAFVQQVQVKPDEQAKEAPFIKRNIEATRAGYGLSGVKYTPYDAVATPDPDVLSKDKATLSNIRLMDPYIIARTVEQLQQLKGFYSFAPTMDVTRYNLGGQQRGAMVAVREVNLDGIPESQRNWVTNHLIYTHGIGLVAAYDNSATADGEPELFESDVPPSGSLGIKQPRIYFGERTTSYSIVGGSGGIELDYPDDNAPSGQQNTTYTGKGGVPVGSYLNKLLFAARFSELNILLSEQVTANSRILYNRTPTERVKALAPWLTLDGDPYPAVVDGRVLWVVDGYTTSDRYPYSQFSDFGNSTTDSTSVRTVRERLNYLRNSVKAVVDAYDGTVKLYAWDETDPILGTYAAAFPGLISPKSSMSEGLLSQVRYPEDMFKVQRDILKRYHITDPKAFFTGENFWIIPDDPTASSGQLSQPPYYLNLQMPGESKATFSLTSTFAPAKRPSLAAFVAVNSEAGPDYGKITVLQLPSQTTIPGPVQAQNIFESDAAISSALSLLRRGGSETEQGNLLSLPVGGGVLYVEPVFVRSSGAGGYPLLRKVMVGFGQKVVMADTLQSALQQVLGTSVQPNNPDTPSNPADTALQKLNKALASAQAAYAAGQKALANGDWTAYGEAQKKLNAAIAAAQKAEAELTAGTKS